MQVRNPVIWFHNLLNNLESRLERDEKGQWNYGGPVGLLITVVIVIILIIVVFKLLDRV